MRDTGRPQLEEPLSEIVQKQPLMMAGVTPVQKPLALWERLLHAAAVRLVHAAGCALSTFANKSSQVLSGRNEDQEHPMEAI